HQRSKIKGALNYPDDCPLPSIRFKVTFASCGWRSLRYVHMFFTTDIAAQCPTSTATKKPIEYAIRCWSIIRLAETQRLSKANIAIKHGVINKGANPPWIILFFLSSVFLFIISTSSFRINQNQILE